MRILRQTLLALVPLLFRIAAKNKAVQLLCNIRVDLRELPDEAFQRMTGAGGRFCSITYQLEIVFAPIIEFRVVYNGDVYGTATATYV